MVCQQVLKTFKMEMVTANKLCFLNIGVLLNVLWKDWCFSWNSSTLATSYEELTHWKRPWFWEGLGAGGEGDDRGWDGWMASPTWWTWVWVNSGSWWCTGRPGVLQYMRSRSRTWLSDWIELDWTELKCPKIVNCSCHYIHLFLSFQNFIQWGFKQWCLKPPLTWLALIWTVVIIFFACQSSSIKREASTWSKINTDMTERKSIFWRV